MATDTFERLASSLDKVKRNPDGSIMACCPAHNDKNPSLSVTLEADGKILFKCFAGCDQSRVHDTLKSLVPEASFGPDTSTTVSIRNDRPPMPKFESLLKAMPSSVYPYHSSAGVIISYICRMESPDGSKSFRPIYWNGKNWAIMGMPKPRILYDLHKITANNPDHVLIVEGEKAAEAAKVLFPYIVVTTWANGAKAIASTDWKPLNGRKITIWPDADEPGKNAAKEIARQLSAIDCEDIRVVDVSDLSKGWDLADPIPDGIDINAKLEGAVSVNPSLVDLMMTASELRNHEIPEREYIIEPFLPSNSLSMVYARRGLGKTWFALTLSLAVARGVQFLSYHVPNPQRVLYIDGEMAMTDLKDRLVLLNGPETEDLILLPSEKLFRESVPLNINDETHQQLIVKALERLERQNRRPSLIILDNLSSLGGGIDENDNSALDKQLRWLISLRHMSYAVMLIHHAGKSGDQRGASRREDLLDTVIKLEPVDKSEMAKYKGAVCDLEFVKTRGATPQPNQMRLELVKKEDGSLDWASSKSGKVPPQMQTLKAILKGKWEGTYNKKDNFCFETQNELAEALNMSKGTASKHVAILRKAGFVLPDHLMITPEGFEALRSYFDDIRNYAKHGLISRGVQEKLQI
jgi:DNA-binding MarR family transcriptional regulator/5S rRNA maturation endonuclease (ribonuclease M5)